MEWRFTGDDRFDQEAWMTVLSKNDITVLPPQWHMKSWHDLVNTLEYDAQTEKWNPIFGIKWSAENEEQIVSGGQLRLALQVALAGKMAMQGLFGGIGNAPNFSNTFYKSLADYFHDRFLYTGLTEDYPGNYNPVTNFSPVEVTPVSLRQNPQEFIIYTDHNPSSPEKIGDHWFMRQKLPSN